MRTRLTTRRAQVLEAHAVVIGALVSALARLIHRRCRQMRLVAGPAWMSSVCPRAYTIPHTTAHTGTCSGAHTCARLPMSTCATSHTHTAPLSHALGLTHCAHAHMHTHTDGTSQERHTQTHTHAHTCTHMHTRTQPQLPTYTHTQMNTHRHAKEHARAHTHIHKRLCACVTHTCDTHKCTHTERETGCHMNKTLTDTHAKT
jgi:hypothetical protein